MNALKFPGGSFDLHYPISRSIAAGINPYGEEATVFHNELGLNIIYSASSTAKNANMLPSAATLMLPLSLFEPSTANLVWCVCNVIAALLIVVLLKFLFLDKLCDGENKSFICLVFITVFMSGTPLRNIIGNGQSSIISFLFFLLSLWFSEKDHRILAGISLSAAMGKYTLTVPLALYYIYKRKYKEIIITAVIHIILTLAVSIWLGMSPVEMVTSSLHVSSLLSAEGLYDICSLLNIQGITVSAALFVIMAAFTYYCSMKAPGHDNEIMAILAVFSLAFVYHRIYDYFVLIIPLIIVMLTDKYSLVAKILTCLTVIYIFFLQRLAVSLCSENVAMYLDYTFAAVFYLMFLQLIYTLIKDIRH